MTQTNPMILLVTSEADEPEIRNCFIQGYESEGATYTGQIHLMERASINAYYAEQAIANNCQIITWNSTNQPSKGGWDGLLKYYLQGLLFVMPITNSYGLPSFNIEDLTHFVKCGAGEFVSQSGKDIEIFDEDPFKSESVIENMFPTGNSYPISQIMRVNANTISMRLTGIPDPSTIGFCDSHGIPFRITGLTGTDVSPLPSGLKYAGRSGDAIFFTFSTSSGTTGIWQNVSGGNIKFGYQDGQVFVKTVDLGFWFSSFGIDIRNVSGFVSNPNGIYVSNFINNDGYLTKFEFPFNTGGGTFIPSPTCKSISSTTSYATPYIAGKLAYIKDTLNCSWWEARMRMRFGANPGEYISPNGWGKFRVPESLSYSGPIPDDPNLILGNVGSISAERTIDYEQANVTINKITNATDYKILLNGELLQWIPAGSFSNSNTFTFLVDLIPGTENKFEYLGILDSEQTELSNSVYVPTYPSRYLLIKQQLNTDNFSKTLYSVYK